MKRKLFTFAGSLIASLGLVLGFNSPAMAAWSGTLVGKCQVNSSHYMYAEQQADVNLYGGSITHFNRLIVNAPGATEIRASIRTSSGRVVQGPRYGVNKFDFNWNFGVSTSFDPRVRIYYYYGTGCNLTLNPPNN